MRENCTSGLMRGSNGNGDSRPLLSTLLAISIDYFLCFQLTARSSMTRIRRGIFLLPRRRPSRRQSPF
jgi:hypothetical protein